MLGEADDLGLPPAAKSVSGASSLFSACSNAGSTGQPCGQRSGLPSRTSIRSTISSRERVTELVGVHMRLGGGVAHEVGEEALDDPVLSDDPLRALDPGVGQDRLLLLAALDEPFGLEPLQHLAGGCTRDTEHVGNARGDRGRGVRIGPVLADREGEEVDRFQVLVD